MNSTLNNSPEPCRIILGTADGVRVMRFTDGEMQTVGSSLEGSVVRSLEVHPEDRSNVMIGCGLGGYGLFRSTNGGKTAEQIGFVDNWVWGITRHPTDPERLFVGTEPPMLYESVDDGQSFTPFQNIEELPSRDDWKFFHEPFYEGHIHAVEIHPDVPERIVAGVENGPVIYSEDHGDTWQEDTTPQDVHRIGIDPSDPDHVLAGCGYGLYRTTNGAKEWSRVDELGERYIHAVRFRPGHPEEIFVYTENDEGTIHRSRDAGETWEPVGTNLPSARPADTLRFHPTDDEVLIYVGDTEKDESRIFTSEDLGENWTMFDSVLQKTWRLAVSEFP